MANFLQKYGWILFFVIGALGIIFSLQFYFAPESAIATFSETGYSPGEDIGTASYDYILFLIEWMALALFAANFFTVLIAATAFKKGKKWAWYAMLYWPALFASHFFLYQEGPFKWLQVFWFTTSLLVLAATYKKK